MKSNSGQPHQGPMSAKQQDKIREVGTVKQMPDTVQRTVVSKKELDKALPDRPSALA